MEVILTSGPWDEPAVPSKAAASYLAVRTVRAVRDELVFHSPLVFHLAVLGNRTRGSCSESLVA